MSQKVSPVKANSVSAAATIGPKTRDCIQNFNTLDQSQIADEHTFHYTNAASQVQGFKAGRWFDVEDYVLDRAQTKERRMSVFAGPICRDDDPEYGHHRDGEPWRIPVSFWKVVVVEKQPGKFGATAFTSGRSS
ncbi:MAG: DNA/RNA non-specific endonuclease [Rhizobiaceae bacterium]|nr:DNA/RNA non-specific endonuclease [Rhizobiaceae bacterium]